MECETPFSFVPLKATKFRNTGFGGCSANWTACVAACLGTFDWLWTSNQLLWTGHTNVHCWISMKKIGPMHTAFSNALQWRLDPFA